MNVLWLGPYAKNIEDFLRSRRDAVTFTQERLAGDESCFQNKDFLVSFGYRHRLPAAVLDLFPERALNIHISYLPWNRGADPNLWSFLEDTPKGVTVHFMTEAIDAGPVLGQKKIAVSQDETLKTSYAALQQAAADLFFELWPAIKKNEIAGEPQAPGGSFHRKADAEAYAHLLQKGWDTPVKELTGKAMSKKDTV